MRRCVWAGVLLAAVISTSSAQARVAASADLDVRVILTTATTVNNSNYGNAAIQNGQSRTIGALSFTVGLTISNNGPDDAAGLSYGVELPAGLHWQPGQTDPECTFRADGIDCKTSDTVPNNTTGIAYWKVTADAPGSYLVRAHASSATPDADPTDNNASATAVVQLHAAAGAARVLPKRPEAGSVVNARVGGITFGGALASPTAASCSATIGTRRVSGSPRSTVGTVTCRYRTPRSAHGKQLRGSVSFAVEGNHIRRSFAVKLR